MLCGHGFYVNCRSALFGMAKAHEVRSGGPLMAPNGLDPQQFEYPLCIVELTKRGHRVTAAHDPERTTDGGRGFGGAPGSGACGLGRMGYFVVDGEFRKRGGTITLIAGPVHYREAARLERRKHANGWPRG